MSEQKYKIGEWLLIPTRRIDSTEASYEIAEVVGHTSDKITPILIKSKKGYCWYISKNIAPKVKSLGFNEEIIRLLYEE